MAGVTDERLRVAAIIHALKAVGIRVKNWKNFLNGEPNCDQTLTEKNGPQRFAFGRHLHLLPQHQLSEMGGTVPQFLVEACGFLSQHLNTEGLFRKTGSLSRIRALRADLEQGKKVFLPPHVDNLQSCDVASLLKQFLRELPSPLIPVDLQGPLIQAQGLEMSHDQEAARIRITLLVTALIPSSHARALRYICSFLRQAAERCSENRMDLNSLAVVIAPNLLQCPAQPSKLTVDTEKHLDHQAAVIKSLVLNAERIGVVPSCVSGASKTPGAPDTPSPVGSAVFYKRPGLGVYRSLRRQRRRSVGEIFVDAFSKLKPNRTPTGPPISLDAMPAVDLPLSKSPTPHSPITVKRKAVEETVPELGSAKKRRSLHDLREDMQSSVSQPTEVSASGHSPLEEKASKEDLNICKKKNIRELRKSLRPQEKEEKVHRRKKSLRFFTLSNHTPTQKDLENCLEDHKVQTDYSSTDGDESPRVPLILIDGPGGVVVGNEVEDDPDLLNCSFVESPNECINATETEVFCIQEKDNEEPCEDECWTVLEDDKFLELEEQAVISVTSTAVQEKEKEEKPEIKLAEEPPRKESKEVKKKSKNRSRPRRSISLPEVTLESCCDQIPELVKEVGRGEPEMENNVWPLFASLTLANKQENEMNVGTREPDGQETTSSVKTRKNYKQEKMPDTTLGFKRPHQRLSMAERLRGFSALTLLLRTSRAAPQFRDKPQECQRGATRLRRQGARRFGRSISHEGVPERPHERSPERSPSPNQAHMGICDASPDSGVESVDHELIQDLHQEEVCKNLQNSPLTRPGHYENVDCFLASTDEEPKTAVNKIVFQFPSDQLNKPTLDLEKFDLHKLLDQKCHIDDQVEYHHGLHQVVTPDSTSLTLLQQMVPLNPFEDTSPVEDPKTDQVLSLHKRVEKNPSWLDASPTFQFAPCRAFGSLLLDDIVSEDDTGERSPFDLSPPAFQFRRPITRRHYRDSPRWPTHEVRMSAWNPLPL